MIRSFNFFEAEPRLRSSAAIRSEIVASLRPFVAAGVFALGIVSAMCLVAYQEYRGADAEYVSVASQTAGVASAPAVVVGGAPVASLQRVLAAGVMAESYRASGGYVSTTFMEVAGAVPAHVWLTRFDYDAATVKISGTLREPALFDGMQTALSGLRTVRNPFPETISPAAGLAPAATAPPFPTIQNVGVPGQQPTAAPTAEPRKPPDMHLTTFSITLARAGQTP